MKTTEEFSKQLYDKWGLTLLSEYTGAHKVVKFTCSNGHENEAVATNVLQRGYKCKECIQGRKVISKIEWTPELIKQIMSDLSYNTTAAIATKYSTTESAINNMIFKNGLSNPRDRMFEQTLVNILLKQDRKLISIQGDFATVKCSNNHTHKQQASNIAYHNTGCPSCFSLGISKAEESLLEYIKSIYTGWVLTKDRTILGGKELDIVLPDLGIAIEFNGTYWHNEDKVGRTYHQDKTNNVEAFGYQLLHIKDYDWSIKPEIVKSIISSKLGVTTKLHARKCIIKEIVFPAIFLANNHIQGPGQPTSKNYGLFYREELVAVATFTKPRFSDEADLELVRFCSKLNTTVVGGLSKILKMLPKGTSLLSYASRDYSNGKAYTKVGFTLLRSTAPGLEYYKRLEKVSRYAAQSMSEEELSKYHKYYNSGNLVFIKTTD